MSTSGRHQLPEHIRHELFGATRRGGPRSRRNRWAYAAGAVAGLAVTALWLFGPGLSVPL